MSPARLNFKSPSQSCLSEREKVDWKVCKPLDIRNYLSNKCMQWSIFDLTIIGKFYGLPCFIKLIALIMVLKDRGLKHRPDQSSDQRVEFAKCQQQQSPILLHGLKRKVFFGWFLCFGGFWRLCFVWSGSTGVSFTCV